MNKLINYTEASRILTGKPFNLRRKVITKAHKEQVKELEQFCKEWEIKNRLIK